MDQPNTTLQYMSILTCQRQRMFCHVDSVWHNEEETPREAWILLPRTEGNNASKCSAGNRLLADLYMQWGTLLDGDPGN